MALPGIVTFTTDFGIHDTYVGQMKGAALAIRPDLTLVDVTHEVRPHDVLAGAVALKSAFASFPRGTIHVAVVDPGVGTERRGVVVRTENYFFVAPDNGVLSLALEDDPPGAAHVLEAAHLRRHTVSPTFHGRDVFAPAAGWIARGVGLENFGPSVGDLKRLELPAVELEAGRQARVRVLLVDRFGNATLNLSRRAVERWLAPGAGRVRVETPGGLVSEIRETYASGMGRGPFLLINSAGFLEVALREGRADDALGLAPGDEVVVTVGEGSD